MTQIRRIDYNQEAAEHLAFLQKWASFGELRGVLLRLYLFAVESDSYHATTHLEQKEMAKFIEEVSGFLEGVQTWSDAREFVEGEEEGA